MSTLDIIVSDKSLMLQLNDISLSTANIIGPIPLVLLNTPIHTHKYTRLLNTFPCIISKYKQDTDDIGFE